FEVADNRIFEAIHDAFAGWVEQRRSTLQLQSFTEQRAHRQHTEIFNAIAGRDPDAAETAMRLHLQGWWAAWCAQRSTRTRKRRRLVDTSRQLRRAAYLPYFARRNGWAASGPKRTYHQRFALRRTCPLAWL
ncbi:MAG: FCD domain-containing protein, partial [Alphaproteobacteria bacterium]